MSTEVVSYETRDGIARITLDRPAVHNALAPESVRALARIWSELALDRTARVAILRGEGRSFCAGMDLKLTDPGFGRRRLAGEGGDDEPEDPYVAMPGERRRIAYVPPPGLCKPVIAAIQGVALGGGLELALACDIRIASEDARFGLPEVTRGLAPGSGGMYWLPRIVGVGAAMELLTTGRIVDAREALALRLVNRVVPPDRLEDEAEAMARRIADNPPLAVQAIKETVWRTLDAGPQEGLAVSENMARVLRLTEDAREGARAFEEKRPARFRGR